MGMDPITLAIISTAVTAVGSGVSAYNSYQSGKATERLNNYNADLADQQAADTERDGRILANAQRAKNQKMQARQRALYAKGGVVTGTGSPLLVQAEQAGEMEMAALEVERTADAKAARLKSQAVLDRMAGKNARSAGNLNAAATLLSGAGKVGYQGAQIKLN